MNYAIRSDNGRVIWNIIAVVCILFVVGTIVHPILARSYITPEYTCQTNLKHIWKAFAMYQSDWDATLPSSFLCGRSKIWNPDDFTYFASQQGTLPAPPETLHRSWPMVLSSYISDSKCLWCPLDRGRSNSPSARISYYWKAAIDRAWYGDDTTGERFQKEGDYLYQGDQIILYERNSWHYNRYGTGLANGALINCAYMDGHVCAVEIRDSGYSRREDPAGPLPRSGVGEPAWFNYSIGGTSPEFRRGQNWNPYIWADRMHEHSSVLEDPTTTCQANLKRLATAISIYANDWDSALPSSYLYGHSNTWNPDDFVKFASRRGILPPLLNTSSQSWPMVLYPYLRTERILWCPSDIGKSREPSACVSYYWKAAVDAAWYGGPECARSNARTLNDYLYPAYQVVLYERNGWHGWNQRKGLANGVMINCAFVDGHVSMKTIRNSGHKRSAGPLPASFVGEPAWFNYSFGDSRPAFSTGDNWDPRFWGDNMP